jgi:sugar lactone lactonase YvrE
LLYVADTWNQRIQVFTLDGAFVRQWPVVGWESQSTVNKPYLASDSAGRVYVSDPEHARIIIFDAEGTPLVVLRGAGGGFFQTPTGLALDTQDHLWVSDAANNRLLRFPAMEIRD